MNRRVGSVRSTDVSWRRIDRPGLSMPTTLAACLQSAKLSEVVSNTLLREAGVALPDEVLVRARTRSWVVSGQRKTLASLATGSLGELACATGAGSVGAG